MAKTETLTDTFDTAIDSAKWTPYGTASIDTGRLKLLSLQAYSGIVSKDATLDLRESYVFAKLTPPAPATSRETLINVYKTGNPQGVFFGVWGAPGSQQLLFRNRYGSTNYDTYAPYDPVAHAWLRVRLSGTTVYWDTSPDGSTWTNREFKTNTADLSQVQVELSCGQWQAEADTQNAYVDYLNVILRTGRPKVWNGISWVSKPAKVWTGSGWVEKPVKVQDGVGGWKLAK